MIEPTDEMRQAFTARQRVLTRWAVQARAAADRIRSHAFVHGHDPVPAARIAADLERHAAECDAAAAVDPSLPTPQYLPEEGTRP